MQINWSPAYKAIKTSPETVALLSEAGMVLLSGKPYADIYDLIEEGGSVFQPGRMSPAENSVLLNYVERLLVQERVRYLDDNPGSQNHLYRIPDFNRPWRKSTWTDIEAVSLLTDEAFDWQSVQLNVVDPASLPTLVFVDDYLDPRLSEVARESTGNAWLPIKPTGEHIIAGPLMNGRDEVPCVDCVTTQLLQNLPARARLGRDADGRFVPLPTKMDQNQIAGAVSAMLPEIARLMTEAGDPFLIQYHPDSGRLSRHALRKLPQCPACGDGELFAGQLERSLQTGADSAVVVMDNGCRSQSAEQTYSRLQSQVSPLVGSVALLAPLETAQARPDNLHIYQSAFYKAPHHHTDPSAYIQRCLGKGISDCQSKVSALCEAIERRNAHYQGDEPYVAAAADELSLRAIEPQKLAPFSEAQYRAFEQLGDDAWQKAHAATPLATGMRLPWTKAWSLTNREHCYLPTTYCFTNTPFEEVRHCRWGSNGCAAGNTLEEALLQGLLELLERDAVAIWWYNKIERPVFDLSILPQSHRERIDHTLGEQWQYWVLDISNDIGIATAVAVGRHKQNGKFILGFGCHLFAQIAVERALTELCQLLPVRDQKHKPFDFDEIKEEPYLLPAEAVSAAQPLPGCFREGFSVSQVLSHVQQQTEARSLEVIALDYSRADIPLYTVNVAVPGLCHIWPQLGARRLYEVPVALGWRETILAEEALNPLPLYV